MPVSETNRLRYRAILLSREVKWLFGAAPGRFKAHADEWAFKALFVGNDGRPHVTGEHVLADLRDFCSGQPLFSTDPLVMARRIGRREVFERIANYLALDEATVQRLMVLDDGLGE